MDKQKYMLFSERKKLADEYEEWVNTPLEDGSKIKDCALSVITFMQIKGYRKIPEGAVVLTREEYEELQKGVKTYNYTAMFKAHDAYRWEQGYLQGCKETAEKFAERVKEETDHGISALYDSTVDEICEEITEGKNNA